MKHLGWAFALLLLATGIGGCKRADPKGSQMAGEPSRPVEAPIAAPGEAPIAAPGEAPIAAPGMAPVGAMGGEAKAAAKDTSYAVSLEVPADVSSAKEAVASVKVTPGAGYKMNHEYPTKLTLQPTDGVSTAKAVLLKGDAAKFDDHQLAFDVKLTAAKAGTYTVLGTLAFAVCTDATCDPKTEKIAINLIAK
jgi:hypothetical protein